MIIASHLRIGNYVYNDAKGLPKGYEQALTASDIWYINACETNHSDHQFYPIPLTYEYLKKLGFVKINGGFENGIRIEYVPEMDCYWLETNNEVQTSPIKYVHQLQNLHFALQGKELLKK